MILAVIFDRFDRFSFGKDIRRAIVLDGRGDEPVSPRKTILAPTWLLEILRRMLIASQRRPKVARALSASASGTRAPEPSKYPMVGIAQIFLTRIERILGEQL